MVPHLPQNIANVMSVNDITQSIFGFMTDGPFEENVIRLRTVNRAFDSAVRQTRRDLKIDTSSGPYELRSRWPKVNDLFVAGMPDDEQPFVFPDPEIFTHLFPSLTKVTTYHAAIDITTFLAAMNGLPRLTSFGMECDWGDEFPGQFRITTKANMMALTRLVQNAPLVHLSLTGQALDALVTTPFMHALATNGSIVHLDLSRSSCSLEDLAYVMRTNRSIVHIGFNNPQDNKDGIAPVAVILASNENTTLKSLSILGSDISILANAMRTNTTLEDLKIGPFDDWYDFHDLTYNDLVAINGMLAVNSTLTSLTLDGNSVGHVLLEDDDEDDEDDELGVNLDMSALLTNTTLRSFTIQGFSNSVDRGEVVQDVCYKIGRNQSGLTSLNLGCNADDLADLSGNTTLTSLMLYIHSGFVAAELGPIFASMTSLSELDLRLCDDLDQTQRAELVQHIPSCTIHFPDHIMFT
jgi:hypothetical protein